MFFLLVLPWPTAGPRARVNILNLWITLALLLALVSCSSSGANGNNTITTTGTPVTYMIDVLGQPAIANQSCGIKGYTCLPVTLIVDQ